MHMKHNIIMSLISGVILGAPVVENCMASEVSSSASEIVASQSVAINSIEDFLNIFKTNSNEKKAESIAIESLKNEENLRNLLGEIYILPEFNSEEFEDPARHVDNNLVVYCGKYLDTKADELICFLHMPFDYCSIFDFALAMKLVRKYGTGVLRRQKSIRLNAIKEGKEYESVCALIVAAMEYALFVCNTKTVVSHAFFEELVRLLRDFFNKKIEKSKSVSLSKKDQIQTKLLLIAQEIRAWRDINDDSRRSLKREILANYDSINKQGFSDKTGEHEWNLVTLPESMVMDHFKKLLDELRESVNNFWKVHSGSLTKTEYSALKKTQQDVLEKIDWGESCLRYRLSIFHIFKGINEVLLKVSDFKASLLLKVEEASSSKTKKTKKMGSGSKRIKKAAAEAKAV